METECGLSRFMEDERKGTRFNSITGVIAAVEILRIT